MHGDFAKAAWNYLETSLSDEPSALYSDQLPES